MDTKKIARRAIGGVLFGDRKNKTEIQANKHTRLNISGELRLKIIATLFVRGPARSYLTQRRTGKVRTR